MVRRESPSRPYHSRSNPTHPRATGAAGHALRAARIAPDGPGGDFGYPGSPGRGAALLVAEVVWGLILSSSLGRTACR